MWPSVERRRAVKLDGKEVATFIFDLDGTLVDSGLDIALSANFVRRHFGLPELPVPTAQSYVGDGVARLLERALGHDVLTGQTGATGLVMGAERLAEGMAVFREHYGAHLLDNTRAYPGAAALLDRLAGVPLHVATNKPRGFTDAILIGTGLAGRFRRIVGGDEAPVRKPDPSHLAAALAGLTVDPAAVVMVGDSPNDVNAARAFGAVAVGCTFGLVAPAVVAAAGPDHLVASLAELGALVSD